ncbi:MAG: pantoate--beta-alanine ligase [Gammaproteobacteria bacterium]
MIASVTRIAELKEIVIAWRDRRQRIALVPTMGNLHPGHLALVEHAQRVASRTVVTLFVNPMQFVAGEDLDRYPRTFEQDRALLDAAGADVLFVPEVAALYPNGLARHTEVRVPGLDAMLCGAARPGHFTGVATVVTKLLNLVRPDLAVFGEKDYQQLLVIKSMVADLCFEAEIHAVETARALDGLALSSRNAYLTDAERAIAGRLYEALCEARDALSRAAPSFQSIERRGRTRLEEAGFNADYFTVRRSSDLMEPYPEDTDLRILAAAWLGKTRLIDNLAARRFVER